ncbi:hypothetical protein BJ742DRAFT_772597 [Cladochytrium replicatum]|nr:hypothetical protein BJ742DRAFT_772597 [Cladochytrium replicatum]
MSFNRHRNHLQFNADTPDFLKTLLKSTQPQQPVEIPARPDDGGDEDGEDEKPQVVILESTKPGRGVTESDLKTLGIDPSAVERAESKKANAVKFGKKTGSSNAEGKKSNDGVSKGEERAEEKLKKVTTKKPLKPPPGSALAKGASNVKKVSNKNLLSFDE